MVLNIVKTPADILKSMCKPVKKITKKHRKLIKNMIETMNHYQGIGLAANQVGEDCRIIVVKNGVTGEDHAYINPDIIDTTGGFVYSKEGCLSIPNQEVTIRRHEGIVLEYTTEERRRIRQLFFSPVSIILQHEIDHLNGILITDY